MGNELFGQYSIEKQPFLSGGYLNLWKIYKASHKERKQDVCVFVFEKKNLEKYPRKERDEILNALKKEASSLAKYKHPSILGIVEPLVEDKYSIGFITERFCYTLTSWIETIKPSKLEIKLMITELCKVIGFLHDDAHVIHSNFNPDVIFIDKDNKLKVSGMSFAINDPPNIGGEGNSTSIVPNLKYTAPEIVFDRKAFYTSDVFSVGLIIYWMLKYHRGDSEKEIINISSNSLEAYKVCYSRVETKVEQLNFEADDNSVISKALIRDHSFRPGIKEMIEHQWFNDPKLKALCFVENLPANDMNKNIEFLQKFPKIVTMFENKLIIKRFLPCLLAALKNETLINACLPCIFSICEIQNLKISFASDIWPKLKDLFQMRSMPAASLFFLLSKVQFIAEHISNSEFAGNFLNIICKALDCNVVKIQTIVIQNLKIITKKIDSLAFKNQIYPRMIQIILSTNSVSFKVEILTALKELYTLLDQSIINDSLLANVEKIRKSDNSSQVCMVILGLYEEIAKIVNIESIANKILPNLIGILVNGQISKSNFEITMKLVHTYLERIRKYREKDLVDDGSKLGTNASQSTNDTFPSLDTFGPPSSSKGNDKDDFLSNFFSSGPQKAEPQPFIMSKPLAPLEPVSLNPPSNTMNTGYNFNLGNSNSTLPSSSTNVGFDFTVGKQPEQPKPVSNLFEGLNTIPSNKYSNPVSNVPKTNTVDLFANLNTKTNPSPSTTTNQFSGMNLNKQINPTFPSSTGNMGGANPIRDDVFNNLLNDLPSNLNNQTTSNLGTNQNTMLNFNTNMNTNFNNMNSFGGNAINTNIGNQNGFNQNSFDFLGGANQANTLNNLDFLGTGTQPSNNSNNTNNYFDFLNK